MVVVRPDRQRSDHPRHGGRRRDRIGDRRRRLQHVVRDVVAHPSPAEPPVPPGFITGRVHHPTGCLRYILHRSPDSPLGFELARQNVCTFHGPAAKEARLTSTHRTIAMSPSSAEPERSGARRRGTLRCPAIDGRSGRGSTLRQDCPRRPSTRTSSTPAGRPAPNARARHNGTLAARTPPPESASASLITADQAYIRKPTHPPSPETIITTTPHPSPDLLRGRRAQDVGVGGSMTTTSPSKRLAIQSFTFAPRPPVMASDFRHATLCVGKSLPTRLVSHETPCRGYWSGTHARRRASKAPPHSRLGVRIGCRCRR